MPKRRVPETLQFVEGLLLAADGIDRTLNGQLEPRSVLANRHRDIHKFEASQIRELGKYQGRVVLAALAAELALKFAWESENTDPAPYGHDLLDLYDSLSDDLKAQINDDYKRGVDASLGVEWESAYKVLETCRTAFEGWRYIVEDGKYPRYVMRATNLIEATRSVIRSVEHRRN